MREPNEEFELMPPKVPSHRSPIATNPADEGQASLTANTLITSHEGIGQTNLTPPDNDLAVGPNYAIEVVNSTFRILDKCGNALYENTINNFLGDNGFLFDPKVFYDPWRDRWSMLWHRQDAGAHTAHLITVSSDDGDPFGTWWFYYFQVDNGGLRWTDYADYGYGSGAVFAAGDEFNFSNTFQFVRFFTFNPSQIYNSGGASVVWDDRSVNPDGSQCFAPRVVKHLNVGLGGGIFINSRVGGASKLTTWFLADPLGAHTWSNQDTNVTAYAVPPDALDPGGNSIATNYCQMMPAYLVFHPIANKWRLISSLNAQNPSETANGAARLYILDPFANTVELDWNFWATGTTTWFATPVPNYDEACNWVFSRAGTGLMAQSRYVNFDGSTFSNSSSLLRAGNSNYNQYRWGDYHGGEMDWGDYFNGTASQKMWFTGEYPVALSTWGTVNGCTLSANRTPGTMTVSGATAMNFIGYAGGPFSPASYTNTLGNTGQVGYNFDVTTPAFLSADVTSGQVFVAGQNVNVSTNANANARPFGTYTGNVVYENCYNGANVAVPSKLSVFAYVYPSSYTINLGRLASGNLASLNSVDGNFFTMCKFIVPNQLVAPVQVEVFGTAPAANVGYVDFLTFAKMATAGSFGQQMQMWNYVTNAYDPTDFRNDALSTSLTRYDLISTGNHNRFIGANNALRAKYSIKQTGPAAALIWCANTDLAGWIIAPP